MSLPKIVASCAVRASNHGDTHGGLFVVDLESGTYDMVVKWNQKIDFHGRGAERGLRGVVKHNDCYYVAASSNLLKFDKDFRVLKNLENTYLKYVHEICLDDKNVIWLASTGFDALVRYSLDKERFVESYQLNQGGGGYTAFDPKLDNQINHRDAFHLNSVTSYRGMVFFCGVQMNHLGSLGPGGKWIHHGTVPAGTHNAQMFSPGKFIMNHTQGHSVRITNTSGKVLRSGSVRKIPKAALVNSGLKENIAQQPFARGLLVTDKYIVGGSSPAMITVYDRQTMRTIKEIRMSNDIRYTIHGITELLGETDE
jgi:hypothetical protein